MRPCQCYEQWNNMKGLNDRTSYNSNGLYSCNRLSELFCMATYSHYPDKIVFLIFFFTILTDKCIFSSKPRSLSSWLCKLLVNFMSSHHHINKNIWFSLPGGQILCYDPSHFMLSVHLTIAHWLFIPVSPISLMTKLNGIIPKANHESTCNS